jgi:hypothetical protein
MENDQATAPPEIPSPQASLLRGILREFERGGFELAHVDVFFKGMSEPVPVPIGRAGLEDRTARRPATQKCRKRKRRKKSEVGQAGRQVYFIRLGERVKIGVSVNVRRRLKSLQTSCPDRLELLHSAGGTWDDEVQLHKRFAADRLTGEWFRLSPEIAEYIERLKRGELTAF